MTPFRTLRHAWPALVIGLLLTWGGAMPPAAAADGLAGHTAGDKLVRGLSNTFLGFMEVPRNIHMETQEENSVLKGWTVGLGKGLGHTVLRMLAGIYEVVTFPFPVPENYRPVVEPEFVWDAQGPELVN